MLGQDRLTGRGGCTRTTPLQPRVARTAKPARHLASRAVPDSNRAANELQPRRKADDLSERILSGEFTDAGSTKEKMTRPIRKFLAQDPVGIGKRCCPISSFVRQWSEMQMLSCCSTVWVYYSPRRIQLHKARHIASYAAERNQRTLQCRMRVVPANDIRQLAH